MPNDFVEKAVKFKCIVIIMLISMHLACFAQTKTTIDAQETPQLSAKELKTPYIYIQIPMKQQNKRLFG